MALKLEGFTNAVEVAMRSGQKAAIEHNEVASLTLGFEKDLAACANEKDVADLLAQALVRADSLKTDFTNPVAAMAGGGVQNQVGFALRAAADARLLQFKAPAAVARLESVFENAPELLATRRAVAAMIGGPGHDDGRLTDRPELETVIGGFRADLQTCTTLLEVDDALKKALASLENVDKLEALTTNPRLPGQGLFDVALGQTASALLEFKLKEAANARRVELAPLAWY